ncbi:MAG: hypothetical protein Q7R74_01990 [bacterium]|nr:hypothetical protein [bacterium]
MTYFLDFDRTLFDTNAFTRSLISNPACADFRDDIEAAVTTDRGESTAGGTGRYKLWESLAALCQHGSLTFAPGELAEFVFPDVPVFLKHHGNQSVIVTYGATAFLKAKIESALAGPLMERVIYTHDREKGIALKGLLQDFPKPYVLVDDLATQLDSVAEHCPEVSLYEIRRDGKEGSGHYPVIHSFAELP